MSTRCRIGLLNKDNTIESVYCHWDGTPNQVGAILARQYKDVDIIKELISKGDMSTLGYTIDTCRFYAEDSERMISQNLSEYFDLSSDLGVKFIYLFDNGKWKYYDHVGEFLGVLNAC